MQSATSALAQAQVLLDPTPERSLFPIARLLPYLNIAYAQLRSEGMLQREITFAEAEVVLPALPVGTIDLANLMQPGAPLATMANPLTLWEKPAGADAATYLELRRVGDLPTRDPQDRLFEYQWLGGDVRMIGATQPLDLKIRFEQIWPSLASPSQALAANDIAGILGYWTAGLMARAMREENLALAYVTEARNQLYLWVARQVKDAQSVERRQRPFRETVSIWSEWL